MSDVAKINLNGTSYDIKDASARIDLVALQRDLTNGLSSMSQTVSAETDARVNAITAEANARESAINEEITDRTEGDNALREQIASLQNKIGSPLVAATTSAMTDTTKIYVYTGTQSGYTKGNWYYHNGSSWVSGGTYNSTAFTTDPTLSAAGAAADAKAVGNRFNYLTARSSVNYLSTESSVYGKSISNTGDLITATDSTVQSTELYLPISPNKTYVFTSDGKRVNTLVVAFYKANKTYISRVTNVYQFTTPSNCAYFRVTSLAGGWQSNKMQVNEGTVALPYEPYYCVRPENCSIETESFSAEAKVKFGNLFGVTLRKVQPEDTGIGYIDSNGTVWPLTENFRWKSYSVKSNYEPYYFTGEFTGSAGVAMASFYNSSGTFLGNNGLISTSTRVYYKEKAILPPDNCAVIKFCGRGDFTIKQWKTDSSATKSPSAGDFFGNKELPTFDCDFCNIIFYGQSLSVGSDAPYVTDPIVNDVDTILNFSTGVTEPFQLTSGNQLPGLSASVAVRELLDKYSMEEPTLITTSFGFGGSSIAQLMSSARQADIKSLYKYSYNIESSTGYADFTASLGPIKTMADNHGSKVCCPAIVFMQGERDYYSDAELISLSAASPHAYACGDDKDRYKKAMTNLKNDMQQACMSAYGQTTKPLFFIYQVSGPFIVKHDMGITEAQKEFAAENDDVILLPATYFTPNYTETGHLSTNGYRWYGEYIGKALFEALVQKHVSKPVLATDATFSGSEIRIKIANAVLPLCIDTYTVEAATNYGFSVWSNGTSAAISKVSIYGDEIVIKTSGTLASPVEVSYAGYEKGGTGNIRDSAKYGSYYKYLDDSADKGTSGSLTLSHRAKDSSGAYLTGANYPMHNWLSPFYKRLT